MRKSLREDVLRVLHTAPRMIQDKRLEWMVPQVQAQADAYIDSMLPCGPANGTSLGHQLFAAFAACLNRLPDKLPMTLNTMGDEAYWGKLR